MTQLLPNVARDDRITGDRALPSGQIELRCASDSYKMDLNAIIVQNGAILSGNWFESEYRQGGKVSGEHENGIVKAKIEAMRSPHC